MQVSFGYTDKRINSTKKTFDVQKTLDVKLKDPCSMRAPVFKVKGLTKGVLYNYCACENRFYWIDDIVYRTFDIQEVHCHLDVLATFKDLIVKSPNGYFVKYWSKQDVWDKECDDPRLNPQVESPTLSRVQTASGIIPNVDKDGTIIMRYMDCRDKGGVRTIAMSYSTFADCLTDLYTIFSGQTIDTILGSIGGSSWRDNILSCIWVPFDFDYYSGRFTKETGFCLGGTPVASGKSVYHLAPAEIATTDFNPVIDLSTLWADLDQQPYLKNSRWMHIILDTALGSLEIPVDYIRDVPQIYARTIIDYASGEVLIKLSEGSAGSGTVLGMLSGKLQMDMMGFIGTGETAVSRLAGSFSTGAKIGLDIASLAIGGSMAVGGAAVSKAAMNAGISGTPEIGTKEGNYALQTTQQVMSSGISAVSSLQGSATGGGAVGSISGNLGLWALGNPGDCQIVVKVLVTSNLFSDAAYRLLCSSHGFPINALIPAQTLGSLGGYVECCGANVIPYQAILNTPSDADLSTMNSYLNSGLFLE